ncbi:fucolectin-5-like [Mytilus edulis]|uniref:fucolectin-5-like n=1 Tax=Mytilus edulis TaxID=6550 RepID=UPI0039EFD66E
MSSVYVPPINQNTKFLCCYSSYAVDEDKSVWTGNNLVCAHSKKDNQQPWWAVDLQNVYDVEVINIYGRTDVFMPACSCNIWNSLYHGDQFQCHFQATASQHITITCPNNTEGRFVRINRRDTKVLVICEVEVYGNQVNSLIKAVFADVNIALKKPTKLSSTHVPTYYLCCNSTYAVDGDK